MRRLLLAGMAAIALAATLTPAQGFGVPLFLLWICLEDDGPRSECGVSYGADKSATKTTGVSPQSEQAPATTNSTSSPAVAAQQQQGSSNVVEAGEDNAQVITQTQSLEIGSGQQP